MAQKQTVATQFPSIVIDNSGVSDAFDAALSAATTDDTRAIVSALAALAMAVERLPDAIAEQINMQNGGARSPK